MDQKIYYISMTRRIHLSARPANARAVVVRRNVKDVTSDNGFLS